MARLLEKSAASGLLPKTIGALTLEEAPATAITMVMTVRSAPRDAIPAPNHAEKRADGWAIWAGRNQALVLGPVSEVEGAVLVDQTDAWCILDLVGPADTAAQVMARVTPVDLRPKAFATGQTVRSLLGHMNASITRIADDRLRILVFRSMAASAIHDLTRAMGNVAPTP